MNEIYDLELRIQKRQMIVNRFSGILLVFILIIGWILTTQNVTVQLENILGFLIFLILISELLLLIIDIRTYKISKIYLNKFKEFENK